MPELNEAAVRNLDPVQATELALLVELEARWENLRKTPSIAKEAGSLTQNLLGLQKAYDAFRSKLVGYNKRYSPPHVAELQLNTPARLAMWCRSMGQLYLRVEQVPQVQCPVHLLEKAYRWAERVCVRLNKDRLARPTPPTTIRTAIQNLEALSQWCDDLAGTVALPATPEVTPVSSGVAIHHAYCE